MTLALYLLVCISVYIFLRSRWLKWEATCLFGHVMPMLSASASNNADSILSGTIKFLMSGNWNKVQHDFLDHMMPLVLALASHDADSVKNGITEFLRSICSEQGAAWQSLWCDAIGTGIGIMWCKWHCQWHQWNPYIKTIEIRWNMTSSVMWHHLH